MEIFGGLSLLAVVGFGFLVMFGIIPLRRVGKSLFLLLAFIAITPMFISSAKVGGAQFLAANHSWWEYLLALLAVLIVIRLLLNVIFPSRRR